MWFSLYRQCYYGVYKIFVVTKWHLIGLVIKSGPHCILLWPNVDQLENSKSGNHLFHMKSKRSPQKAVKSTQK